MLIASLPSDCNLSAGDLNLANNKVDILQQIYQGETKTWGDLLGCQSSTKVIPINREQNSGTRDVFQDKLKIKEFSSALRTVNNTAAAIQEVKNIHGAIGYVSYGAKKLVNEADLDILKYKGVAASPTSLELMN